MKTLTLILLTAALSACGAANDTSSQAASVEAPKASSESFYAGIADLRRVANVEQQEAAPGGIALAFTYRSCQDLAFQAEAADQGGVTLVKILAADETCRGPETDRTGSVSLQRTSANTVTVLNPLLAFIPPM